MRRGFLLASLAVAMLVPATTFAQFRERVKLSNVRLGFQATGAGGRGGAFKAGQWAPVYVDLECVRDTEEKLLLIAETEDADGAITEGAVELPAMVKGDRLNANELGRIPYLQPGSSYGSTVVVRVKGVESGRTYGEIKDRTFSGMDTPQYLLLGIGTNLSGIRFPAVQAGQDEGPASRNGWVQAANILDVGMLPDQWFGYGAVDLMILGTGGDRGFWEALGTPQHEKRRKALAEWVRRGGRMVVSVGTNVEVLEAVKELKDLLPANVPPDRKRTVPRTPYDWKVPGSLAEGRNGIIETGSEFPLATLQPKPDRPTRVILDDDNGHPLAVQSAYGQGRVTVFGLDLDRPPFTEWNKRAAFWEILVNFTAYTLPPTDKKLERFNYGSTRLDEYASALQGSLDYFEGVPVVSFGWVALFILIYIILIGPVDYLFLKKVIRRLEWTWVTFPVIVVAVSAAAYFAAYALKGKDLKINKVDVVDVDLVGKRVDGNTWFTLFSPRIQNYTIGVEPAGPDGEASAWTPAVPSDAARDTVVNWHSYIENRYASGGVGAFSKRYRYQSGTDPADLNRDLYAAGLEGVPIQVWTTKAFHAEWSAPLDPAKPPVSAELAQKGDYILVGSVTNNLPVDEFSDAALLWRGRAFKLPLEWPTGAAKAISVSAEPGIEPASTAEDIKSWVVDKSRYPSNATAYTPGPRPNAGMTEVGTTTNPNFRLWPVLFADFATESIRQYAPNASLRRLDQSWRVALDQTEQAILVLRIPTHQGPAEEVARGSDSPSRLWLGELPTSGAKRPALKGTLKQETYVRVFIPVKAPKK